MGITRVVNSLTIGKRYISSSIFAPRIWKIMIVGAYPLLPLTTNYFEAIERTGTLGAFIADTFLPATIFSYIALIFLLKRRAI